MKHVLRIRAGDRDIFSAIKSGKKRIETRAATPKYRTLAKGDTVVFVCGSERFERTIRRVRTFKTVSALLRVYAPQDVNPRTATRAELIAMYDSFPGYREKLRRYGLVAFEVGD